MIDSSTCLRGLSTKCFRPVTALRLLFGAAAQAASQRLQGGAQFRVRLVDYLACECRFLGGIERPHYPAAGRAPARKRALNQFQARDSLVAVVGVDALYNKW